MNGRRLALLILAASWCAVVPVSAQRTLTRPAQPPDPARPVAAPAVAPAVVPVESRAFAFAVSRKVSELPPDPVTMPAGEGDAEQEMEPRPACRPPATFAGAGSFDAAVFPGPLSGSGGGATAVLPRTSMPSPLVNVEGLSSADNGASLLPPDTVGDVGPNHYVQMTNVRFRVFDKSGNPLTPPRYLASLFAPLGAANRCSNVNDGDPIVLYDPLADRWLMSQFCISVSNPNTHQLVAVSTSGDPTGSYYLYDFMLPNNKLNDYPKFAVWPDAYYMVDQQFGQTGGSWLGTGAFALDRAKMLAGDPSAAYIYFDVYPIDPDIAGMLPSDLDGLAPPPAGEPAYFLNWRADEYGDASDYLQIFEFHADFAHPEASTFTQRPESHMPVPAFDPRYPGRNSIEEPGAVPTSYLDAIQELLMNRLAYRNFGGQESLVVTHTVNVGPDPSTPVGHQSAIRYYELRRDLPGGAFVLKNAATYSPDTDNRWMGSAAQDGQGNIAIGYSVSSSTTSPSIRYAGRLATDPPDGLFQQETTLVAGSGRQTSSSGRWGDYSAMSIDASDDCTFWYTQEYTTTVTAAGWQTRIGSFRFPSCVAADRGALSGILTDCVSGQPIPGAQVQASGGFMRASGPGGDWSMNLAPGAYTLALSGHGYRPVSTPGYIVTNGTVTRADLCLAPVPAIAAGGAPAAAAEACAPASGAIDPGERVSVVFPLRNTGGASSVDLVATLLPGGGVLDPGAPQHYGALAVGGAVVPRTFDFTVDPNVTCGGKVVATLGLSEGGVDLGTTSFELTTGRFWGEDFDAGSEALPAGWVDSAVGDKPPAAWAVTSVTGYCTSGPNSVTISDSPDLSERRLDSPAVAIPTLPTQLTFQNNYSLQTGSDGGVLEISIDGGPFTDVLAAGGMFLAGGYNGTIDPSSASALAGRAAWTGINAAGSSGFVMTRLNLPEAAHGRTVRLRWRAAFDGAISAPGGGWRIDDVALATSTCCGSILVSPLARVAEESCGPRNLGLDPDETVSVQFPIYNVGSKPTTNLVATLLQGGGVFSPGVPQTYGALEPSGPIVSRAFTFVPGGVCGGSITATLALKDGATDLGTRDYSLRLGATRTIYTESFDNVTAPALPPGWSATQPFGAGLALWATSDSSANRVSPPNGAFTGTTDLPADNRLDSPFIVIPPGTSATLQFTHSFSMETGFDGGVLEISVANGPFTDILAAGGVFTANGYSGTISYEAGGPLAARRAWTGTGIYGSNGFIVTTVDLPKAALGSLIRLRWRAGFDLFGSPTNGGWRIDDISIDVLSCCRQACAITCPGDTALDNDPSQCGAIVPLPAPGISGNCGVVTPAAATETFYPVGTTPVTWSGTSVSGGVTGGSTGGTTGSCSFNVVVRDVEPPTLAVSLDPQVLWPPNHQMVPVTAHLALNDNCGAQAVLTALTSSEPDDASGGGDGQTTGDIQNAAIGTSDTQFDLRAERTAAGAGRTYTVSYSAADGAGHTASAGATAIVPHDHDGRDDPVLLRLATNGGAAVLTWLPVPGADGYSVIRGDQSRVTDRPQFVDLGQVQCLAQGATTTNLRDDAIPQVGQVFFYLVSYHLGQDSGYGSPSAAKPLRATGGDCP